MPIYEFECKNCKKVIEKPYGYTQRPDGIICPNCGDIASIIPALSNFHLKGGGWYSESYDKRNKGKIK